MEMGRLELPNAECKTASFPVSLHPQSINTFYILLNKSEYSASCFPALLPFNHKILMSAFSVIFWFTGFRISTIIANVESPNLLRHFLGFTKFPQREINFHLL